MNPLDILVAIQEEKKWVERRERLSDELEEVQVEKRKLMSELLVIKKDIAKLDEAMSILPSGGVLSRSSAAEMDVIK